MTNIQATKTRQAPLFVACGMYAFNDELRSAWQQLFEHFFDLVKPTFEINRRLKFDTGLNILNDPALWFGQTCGYPLMTSLRDTMTPISVPVFDVLGCQQKLYSSLLIVADNSQINTTEDCRGLCAAINTNDSNSGMNLLRHAVASFNQKGEFFGQINLSGSHLQSLTQVANGNADIAAIDCVSYQLIEDTWPELATRVRCIGFTAKTCGLPFVMPKPAAVNQDLENITECLNQALLMLDERQKGRLHLKGFENVSFDDYQCINDLESFAQEAGYPVLS